MTGQKKQNQEQKEQKVSLALLAMQRHSWEQGVAMQAFLERREMDILIPMAYEAAYRSMPDGRAATIGVSNGVTDPCSVGEGLLEAANRTGDPRLKEAWSALLQWALEAAPRSKAGILYHLTENRQFWADSMYMLPPFLASAGYYEEALQQIEGYWQALYDQEWSLMSHMWDDQAKAFARKDFWGVGNGWTLAGMARVIEKLPKEHPGREKTVQKVKVLLQGVLKFAGEDGMFHDVINDDRSFIEVNLSQMSAYTLYKGMKGGWLEQAFLKDAERLRQAAERQVDDYGYVRQVCGAPTFDKPGVAAEAQAFYLLMQQAYKEYREWAV